jgi:hypothetical protein
MGNHTQSYVPNSSTEFLQIVEMFDERYLHFYPFIHTYTYVRTQVHAHRELLQIVETYPHAYPCIQLMRTLIPASNVCTRIPCMHTWYSDFDQPWKHWKYPCARKHGNIESTHVLANICSQTWVIKRRGMLCRNLCNGIAVHVCIMYVSSTVQIRVTKWRQMFSIKWWHFPYLLQLDHYNWVRNWREIMLPCPAIYFHSSTCIIHYVLLAER